MSDVASITAMAPANTGNETVILWAIPILLSVVVILFKMAKDSAKKCEERSEKLEAKQDATQTMIQTRLFSTIEGNTIAFKEMTETMSGLRSDMNRRANRGSHG